jgi:hypothetical protein
MPRRMQTALFVLAAVAIYLVSALVIGIFSR